MATKSSDQRLIEAAEELRKGVVSLSEEFKGVKTSESKRKAQLVILAASVLLDLVLSVGVFYILGENSKNQDVIKSNTITIHQNCLENNKDSQVQRELWTELLTRSERAKEVSKTDPDAVKSFQAYVNAKFPIEDCSELARRVKDAAVGAIR